MQSKLSLIVLLNFLFSEDDRNVFVELSVVAFLVVDSDVGVSFRSRLRKLQQEPKLLKGLSY